MKKSKHRKISVKIRNSGSPFKINIPTRLMVIAHLYFTLRVLAGSKRLFMILLQILNRKMISAER